MASDAYPRVEMDVVEPVTPAGSTSGAPRKPKEELVISKLADQDFDIKKLPNPMVPRHGVDPQFYPRGVTLEMERQWMAQMAAVQARQQQ
ncbi:hypothetical protein JDV02_001373 [Purpureocillium takamizusanense]|uniref:Uncharacterized protein n=1 Tax=Purpureocillium takamizusanense TaxID=2060973 RepID=A0A9Q8V7G2_9HYPO|nr:uncharacterized protein JDV02_001373 [Purpureocillium takamizusanense]UNI14777.1 hypothetical protein JDV02_001373 [Purpureocillium takamizusanense]